MIFRAPPPRTPTHPPPPVVPRTHTCCTTRWHIILHGTSAILPYAIGALLFAALKQALEYSTLTSLELHGPADEINKCRAELSALGCAFFSYDPKAWRRVQGGFGVAKDKRIWLCPLFEVKDWAKFKACWDVDKAKDEPGCLSYSFVYSDDYAYCRESYRTAQDVMDHLTIVDSALQKALQYASITSLQLHGPRDEVEKCKAALRPLGCSFFTYEDKAWTR